MSPGFFSFSVSDDSRSPVERRADHLDVAPDLALEAAAVGVEDADDLPVAALQRERLADVQADVPLVRLRPTMTSYSPGVNIRPSVRCTFDLTANAIERHAADDDVDVVAVLLARACWRRPRFRARPAAALRVARDADRRSTSMLALSRLKPEVSSELEPRCITMALSGEPVALSATRKPFAIAARTSSTAMTSAMPPTASSVTFRGRSGC